MSQFTAITTIVIALLPSTCAKQTPNASSAYYYVSAPSGLFLRDEPAQSGHQIALLPQMHPVLVTEFSDSEVTIENSRARWAKVKLSLNSSIAPGKEGWLFSGFLVTPLQQLRMVSTRQGSLYKFKKAAGRGLAAMLELDMSTGWAQDRFYDGFYSVLTRNSQEVLNGPFHFSSENPGSFDDVVRGHLLTTDKSEYDGAFRHGLLEGRITEFYHVNDMVDGYMNYKITLEYKAGACTSATFHGAAGIASVTTLTVDHPEKCSFAWMLDYAFSYWKKTGGGRPTSPNSR